MRWTLGLVLLLTPALLANAAGPIAPGGNEEHPAPVLVPHPPPEEPNNHPAPEKPNNHPAPAPKKNPPSNPNQGEPEGEGPESDIFDALTNILDAIESILSLEGGTTTITSAGALPTAVLTEPTAAQPCISVWDLFDSCVSEAFYFDTAAATTQTCDDTCAAQTSSSDAAAATIQSSCLCYDSQDQDTSSYAPGLFNGYLSSCNDYVQAQTQLAAQPSFAVATAFCTTATNANVSPTTTTMSITPTVSTSTSSSTSQASSFTTSAATVLSPVIMSSGSWHVVWWTVIVLVGSGWAAYS